MRFIAMPYKISLSLLSFSTFIAALLLCLTSVFLGREATSISAQIEQVEFSINMQENRCISVRSLCKDLEDQKVYVAHLRSEETRKAEVSDSILYASLAVGLIGVGLSYLTYRTISRDDKFG